MTERYVPESARGKLSRVIEETAGKEFGEKRLSKEIISRCLNLEPQDLSDAEWADISEFAVNAGTALWRGTVNPETHTTEEAMAHAAWRIKGNHDGIIPYHDVFHAATTYRLTGGKSAAPRFIQQETTNKYTDLDTLTEELYPLLFLADEWMHKPLPLMLETTEGRKRISDFFTGTFGAERASEIREILAATPTKLPSERRAVYERLVEAVVIANAKKYMNLTEDTEREIRQQFHVATKNPPTHYDDFATRLFNGETNKRLFLDELLACIHTKP